VSVYLLMILLSFTLRADTVAYMTRVFTAACVYTLQIFFNNFSDFIEMSINIMALEGTPCSYISIPNYH
jgi:hypothetical protein